jgi:AcrR family transcriptional regulator
MMSLTTPPEASSLPSGPTGSIEERAVRATLACVARHGLAKTTVDDVAREAGCARATLYRYFGGKRELVRITVAYEAVRIAADVRAAGEAESTLEDAVVAMSVRAARALREHQALQFIFAFEPELALPHVTFDAGNRFLVGAGAALAPTLTRFVPPERAERAGEWLARIVLTHALAPSSPIDLTDEAAARALVHEFVVPGLVGDETASNISHAT